MDKGHPKGLGRIKRVLVWFRTGPVKFAKAIRGFKWKLRNSGIDISPGDSQVVPSSSGPSASTYNAGGPAQGISNTDSGLPVGQLAPASNSEVGEPSQQVDAPLAYFISAERNILVAPSTLPRQRSGTPVASEATAVHSVDLAATATTFSGSTASPKSEQTIEPNAATDPKHPEEIERSVSQHQSTNANGPTNESTEAAIRPIISLDGLQIEETDLILPTVKSNSEEPEQTLKDIQIRGQSVELHPDVGVPIGSPRTVELAPMSTVISLKYAEGAQEDFAWTCGGDLALSHIKAIAGSPNSEVHMMRNTLTGIVFARKLTKAFGTIKGNVVQNEQRAVVKLCRDSHKNLVSVLSVGRFADSSHYFIDMELCDRNLEDYIQTSKVDIVRIWGIMSDISEGAAFIHSQSEVHRDLKPRNILYSAQADCWKIADFGLSADTSFKHTISTELARGTMGYRAPELLAEPPTFNDRADVWALGCILYELTVHKKPFTSDFAVREYKTNRLKLSIPFEEALEPQTRMILTTLIHAMLCFNSKQRPTANVICAIFNKLARAGFSTLEQEGSLLAELSQPNHESFEIESQTSKIPLHKKFLVPYPRNPYFVGRQQLLIDLHEQLSDRSVPKYNHITAIYGGGGIGKTQIAIEYTYRYLTFYENVFWINAKDQAALLAGFQDIADVMGCAQANMNPEEQAEIVLAWLRQQDSWLLVLDNLDDISVAKGYLPEQSNDRHTLITTRYPFSKDIPAEGFEIPLFNSEESVNLLRIRSEAEFIPDVALKIADELGHLPLAIEQAAAFIRKTVKSLLDFLIIYSKYRKSFLQRNSGGNDSYPHSIATMFRLSFDKLKEMENGLQASRLLQLLSFLNPDGISIGVLHSGSEQPEHPLQEFISDDLKLYDMLETLEQFSLVKRSKGDMIIVHRLIQAVVKDGLTDNEVNAWRCKIVELCNIAFPREVMIDLDFPNDVRPLCRVVSMQLLYPLLDAAEICNEGAALALRRVGWFLEEDGNYVDSERLVEQSVVIYKRLFGEECENSLMGMNRLARIYELQGRLKEAAGLGKKVLEVSERVLADEHPVTLHAKDSLTVIHWGMGELTEAVTLGKVVLDARQRVLGEEHPDTLNTMGNLAMAYKSMGKDVEAVQLEEKVLEVEKRIFGEEHPRALITTGNLALTYWTMGKLDEAAALEENVLEAKTRILGEEHPDTLSTKHNLASTYSSLGKHEKAMTLQEKVLEARRRILGEEHPLTLLTSGNLAGTYRVMGKLAEAAALQEYGLEVERRILGAEHPDTLRDLHNLALIKRDMGNFEAAESLGRSAMESMQKILGSEHRWTIDAQSNVADILWDQGMSTEAISLKEQATIASRKSLGDDHPETSKRVKELEGWNGTIASISMITDR